MQLLSTGSRENRASSFRCAKTARSGDARGLAASVCCFQLPKFEDIGFENLGFENLGRADLGFRKPTIPRQY
jgi:hypothetical protein